MATTLQDELTHSESLQIIDNALQYTRNRIGENKFPFLFWGYFIAALSVLHFILMNAGAPNPWIGWVTTPLGWVVMAVYYRNKKDRRMDATPMGRSFIWLWGVLGVNMCLVGFFGHHFIGDSFIAVILLIMSLGTLASGALLKYKPLIVGSVAANLIALAAIIFIPFEYHLLLIAVLAVLCDIIPGHMIGSK